jgi:hypothetical protein
VSSACLAARFRLSRQVSSLAFTSGWSFAGRPTAKGEFSNVGRRRFAACETVDQPTKEETRKKIEKKDENLEGKS